MSNKISCPLLCPVLTWKFSKGVNVKNGVLHLEYETQHELCLSFLRLQEYYESPYDKIYREHFLLEDYMDIYANDKGAFTYLTDWSGFNVPGNIVNQFFKRFSIFGLSVKEKVIYHLVEMCTHDVDDNFYLIGTCREKPQAIEHELAHAKYYLNDDYANQIDEMTKIIKQDYTEPIFDKLVSLGYRDDVLVDELQAYLSTSKPQELKNLFGGNLADHKKYSKGYRDKLAEYK